MRIKHPVVSETKILLEIHLLSHVLFKVNKKCDRTKEQPQLTVPAYTARM